MRGTAYGYRQYDVGANLNDAIPVPYSYQVSVLSRSYPAPEDTNYVVYGVMRTQHYAYINVSASQASTTWELPHEVATFDARVRFKSSSSSSYVKLQLTLSRAWNVVDNWVGPQVSWNGFLTLWVLMSG